eukprot:snap_masked-scaffold_10-processed-gene-6.21-mRNA-1 protein AED:0.44 eAED:1.00 QI:0/0/0/1/1/1/2/0/133
MQYPRERSAEDAEKYENLPNLYVRYNNSWNEKNTESIKESLGDLKKLDLDGQVANLLNQCVLFDAEKRWSVYDCLDSILMKEVRNFWRVKREQNFAHNLLESTFVTGRKQTKELVCAFQEDPDKYLKYWFCQV